MARQEEASTSLLHAAQSGDLAAAKKAIEDGGLINASVGVDTPLHLAALFASSPGHVKVAQLLINEGADINAKGYLNNTPLHRATWKGYVPMVKLLVRSGAQLYPENRRREVPDQLSSGLSVNHAIAKLISDARTAKLRGFEKKERDNPSGRPRNDGNGRGCR